MISNKYLVFPAEPYIDLELELICNYKYYVESQYIKNRLPKELQEVFTEHLKQNEISDNDQIKLNTELTKIFNLELAHNHNGGKNFENSQQVGETNPILNTTGKLLSDSYSLDESYAELNQVLSRIRDIRGKDNDKYLDFIKNDLSDQYFFDMKHTLESTNDLGCVLLYEDILLVKILKKAYGLGLPTIVNTNSLKDIRNQYNNRYLLTTLLEEICKNITVSNPYELIESNPTAENIIETFIVSLFTETNNDEDYMPVSSVKQAFKDFKQELRRKVNIPAKVELQVLNPDRYFKNKYTKNKGNVTSNGRKGKGNNIWHYVAIRFKDEEYYNKYKPKKKLTTTDEHKPKSKKKKTRKSKESAQ